MKLCFWRPIFQKKLLKYYINLPFLSFLFFFCKVENNLCFNWQITTVRSVSRSFWQIWKSSYVDHLAIYFIPPFPGHNLHILLPSPALIYTLSIIPMRHNFIHSNILDNTLEIVCMCVCVHVCTHYIIVSKLVLKSDFAISLQYFV